MNLSNAFARRKQIDSEIGTWLGRLRLAGKDSRQYRTESIETEPYDPIPGTVKEYNRNYTIDECREKLDELITEDRDLAMRISLTNQVAKATIIDLDGEEKELTIPELLVLKNDVAPTIEDYYRAIPTHATGVEIIKKTKTKLEWRNINPVYTTEKTVTEKGQVMENRLIDYYTVEENTDYGVDVREIYDMTDNVHEWQQRIKEAINRANQTELVDL